MKVHWTERGVDRVESVVSCHVCLEFEDEWGVGCVQPIRVDSHSRCCNLQEFHCCMVKREVERIGYRQTGKSWSRANRLWTIWLEFSIHRAQQCKRMELRHQQTWQNQLQTPQRSIRQRKSPCPLNGDNYSEQPNQINVYLKVKTQRQRDTLEFTHSRRHVYGKAADDLNRRRQHSDLEDASVDRTDIAAEAGMDKVLVNHNNGAVAVTGPKEVTEYTVRVGCEKLDK